MNKVLELATKYEDWIIDLRRHFHMYPEASYEEYETTKKIIEELEKLGVEYQTFEDCTGVIAKIEGNKDGRIVALRSDIDALCVLEKNDVPYKSKNEGFMHACGHDAHTAMNLGAVKILNELKDEINGTVYFIFQPAEEVGSGAKTIIKKGDWFDKVDNFFGAHIWSNVPSGKISVESGPRMASADKFKIVVKGVSGHGAQPEQTVDATIVASSIVLNLQTMVSREFSPMESVVVTIGKLTSGTRFNIISGEAILEGTCRYFSKEIGKNIVEVMSRIVENTAKAFRAEASVEYDFVTLPLINDEASSKIATKAVEKMFGEEAIEKYPKTTGGEDFSYYIENKPGVFAFIGCANPDLGTDYAHHNERFNVDESVLKNGSALYAQYAIDYLNS
ncbi:MAG: amidohydrolase [Erysipelotrichaceae bacterium]|nr:amidohydrolase [Erysipelotrichaceae bacterium]